MTDVAESSFTFTKSELTLSMPPLEREQPSEPYRRKHASGKPRPAVPESWSVR